MDIDSNEALNIARILKTMTDTVNGWRKDKSAPPSEHEFGEVLSSWSTILSYVNEASATISNQLSIINALHAEIDKHNKWENEAERYELREVGGKSLVQSLKESQRDVGEPAHWLCTHCFNNKRKSIMQPTAAIGTGYDVICPSCQHIKIWVPDDFSFE